VAGTQTPRASFFNAERSKEAGLDLTNTLGDFLPMPPILTAQLNCRTRRARKALDYLSVNGHALFFVVFFSSFNSLLAVWFISCVATIAFARLYIWRRNKTGEAKSYKSKRSIDKLVAAAAMLLIISQALKTGARTRDRTGSNWKVKKKRK
jgi:hypothetical protein